MQPCNLHTYAVATSIFLLMVTSPSALGLRVHLRGVAIAEGRRGEGCGLSLQFKEYIPSTWERSWLDRASTLQDHVCETLLEEDNKAQKWLETLKEFRSVGTVDKVTWDPEIFSKYVYTNRCRPQDAPIEVYIEPAVGALRHPYGACTMKTDVQDRSYILLSGLNGTTLSELYPGRKYLFDLGTQGYDSSLKWLEEAYRAEGVEFDEVFAWEIKTADPTTYWSRVPENMVEKLHFYNYGIDNDISKARHPLNIIKDIYRPGDLVIIKLDIDNEPLESFILQEFKSDPQLPFMVADIFTELHFDDPSVRPWFGGGLKQRLPDVLETFNKFRSLGIRLHPWP